MKDNIYNNKVMLNTPTTGIIQRTYAKSFFTNIHYDSKLAETLFNDNPSYYSIEVIVLQCMLTHKEYMMIELIRKDDFVEINENITEAKGD